MVERKRTLLARSEECDRLDQIVEATRRGLSGVLVLRGEPGVGKTSLLEYVQPAPSWSCRSPIWRASRAKWSSASPPYTSSFDPVLATSKCCRDPSAPRSGGPSP